MKIKHNPIVAGIIRKRKPISPSGDDLFMQDDHVIVIAAGEKLRSLADVFED